MYCDFYLASICHHESNFKKRCGRIRAAFCKIRKKAERLRLHKVAIVREGFVRTVGLKGLRF